MDARKSWGTDMLGEGDALTPVVAAFPRTDMLVSSSGWVSDRP